MRFELWDHGTGNAEKNDAKRTRNRQGRQQGDTALEENVAGCIFQTLDKQMTHGEFRLTIRLLFLNNIAQRRTWFPVPDANAASRYHNKPLQHLWTPMYPRLNCVLKFGIKYLGRHSETKPQERTKESETDIQGAML